MFQNWIDSVANKNKYNCIADKYWQPSTSLLCFPRNLSDGKSCKQTHIMYIKRVRSGQKSRSTRSSHSGKTRCFPTLHCFISLLHWYIKHSFNTLSLLSMKDFYESDNLAVLSTCFFKIIIIIIMMMMMHQNFIKHDHCAFQW